MLNCEIIGSLKVNSKQYENKPENSNTKTRIDLGFKISIVHQQIF